MILEAWRAGVAVVASNRGGASEFVRDGQDGVLVDPFDTVALTAALERLLVDPAERNRMAAAGRARVAEFSWSRIAAAYRSVYRSVVATPPGENQGSAGISPGPAGPMSTPTSTPMTEQLADPTTDPTTDPMPTGYDPMWCLEAWLADVLPPVPAGEGLTRSGSASTSPRSPRWRHRSHSSAIATSSGSSRPTSRPFVDGERYPGVNPPTRVESLAARFAAKEAVLKVLRPAGAASSVA